MSKIIIALFFLLISQQTISQDMELSGTVRDTTAKLNVKNAVVLLLSPGDSVLEKYVRTDGNGHFKIKNISKGTHIFMVMHPLFADYVDNIDLDGSVKSPWEIPLTPKSKLLEAVIIKSGSPIRIKGDTTIYTADSFKVSANANVEELLKKLPGIQVDKNGEIKAMGETVEKVLVDGEEFFGDDPGMAVKNLRADAVKEVQVFDKKSEQAEFTGIDDGQTKKTINLKLKENKKTGYFGKVSISGGLQKDIDHRYNNNLMFSSFKGKRKLSAFLLNGNTGQDGLSWQDNEKYGGESDNYSMSMDEDGGMMFMYRGGGSDDEPYVNTENGFIRNINAGVQYSNKWNDRISLGISPKYNSQIYSNKQSTFKQEQLKDANGKDIALNTNSDEASSVNRYNYKFRGTFDVKMDSMNTLKLTASANFYHTESAVTSSESTRNQLDSLLNTRSGNTRTNSDKSAISANIIYKHKFRKARRTLSFTTDWTNLNTTGTNYNKSLNQSFDVSNPFIQDLNQMKDNDKSSNKILSRLVYTEPLAKKLAMEVGYEFSYNTGKNKQETYNYTPATGKWDEIVDTLTNDFKQVITINKPTVKFNYTGKKVKISFGSGFGITNFDLRDNSFNKEYNRNYTNFFPSANINYMYKANHNLRFSYNGTTTQPTVNQLQPLRNNDNYFNQYIGNPDLKPSFTNSFNISHNSYNFLKDMWMYQSFNVQQTSNTIANNRIVNPGSAQITNQPINTNGNYSVQLWSGIGFRMKKIDTRFNFNPNLSFTRSSDVINSKASYAKTLSAGMSVYISKSKEKKYEISLNNDFSYNSNKTSQSSSGINYFVNTLAAEVTVYIHKVWSINTDYSYYIRQKTDQFSSNLDNSLWNARLQKTFKNNEFTAFIKIRDILNQNLGIDRNFYGNTLTEVRNERLKRYWMIGFTWDFKNKAQTEKK